MTDGVGAGGAGFGIENLPFGVARLAGGAHACVSALAARVIDLSVLDRAGSFAHVDLPEGVLEEALAQPLPGLRAGGGGRASGSGWPS